MAGLRAISGWVVLAAVLSFAHQPVVAKGLAITDVTVDKSVLRTGEEAVDITFEISAPAVVTLDIFDARDRLIRRVESSSALEAGGHKLSWDGRDARGRPVPPEVYVFTLTARGMDGEEVVFDLTDKTGGETVIGRHVEYDPKRQTIRYELPSSARVFVRAGLKDSSVLRTIVNGAVRRAGTVEDSWDGYDESGVVYIGEHPKLQLFVEGFRLSRNSILVVGEEGFPTRPRWIEFADGEPVVYRASGKKRKGLNIHAYHDRDQCRDARITLSLPDDLPRTAEGLPIVSGPVPLRMEVAPEDSFMVEGQHFEVVYFLNGRMIYENEISYTPYTWVWEPKAYGGGVNYLTAFIVGFGRHFGVSTVKFMLGSGQGDSN